MKPVKSSQVWRRVRLKKTTCTRKSKLLQAPSAVLSIFYLCILFLSCLISSVDGSLLPFHVATQSSSSEVSNNLLPSKIVHFERYVVDAQGQKGGEGRVVPENAQDEVFVLDKITTKLVTFKCKARLDPYFAGNDTQSDKTEGDLLEVGWITDDGTILSSNDSLVIEKPSKEFHVRCRALIESVDKLQNGSVLSRSIQFRKKPYVVIEVEPKVFHAPSKSAVRLVCKWPVEYSSEVVWRHNGELISTSENVRIGGIRGKSVLHILSVQREDAGEYRCSFLTLDGVADQPAEVIIDETAPEWEGIDLAETDGGAVGGEKLLECFVPNTKSVTWVMNNVKSRQENEGADQPGHDTFLILRNITKEMSGNIMCNSTLTDGTSMSMMTSFKAMEPLQFNYSKSIFVQASKKQGMTMSFRCETFDLLGETPEMATWFKDAKPVEKDPFVKVVRSSQNGIGYLDLMIGITGEEHSGIYTCIISNKREERIKMVDFEVQVTTRDTLTNLTVNPDHKEKCLRLEFDLPESTELSWAQFTNYFVIYFKHNSTESLNSFPTTAKCNYRGHCSIELCSYMSDLEEYTKYVFQISMVVSGTGTVITPLSAPVTAMTWDGFAKNSLALDIVYLAEENEIELSWDLPPKDQINGKVSKYAIQIINYSDKMTNLLAPMPRDYHEVDLFASSFRVVNVSQPFAYKFRVIPITRSSQLPLQSMSLIEYFPFMLFTSSDDMFDQVDESIFAPIIKVKQVNLLPMMTVTWNKPTDLTGIGKIIIRYQHVLNSKSKFVFLEKEMEENRAELAKLVESGFVYQVCAAFVRTTDKAHGVWKCTTVPVKTLKNSLVFLNEKDAIKQKQQPDRIDCNMSSKCRCHASNDTKSSLRIEWDDPSTHNQGNADRDGADNDKSDAAAVNYVVHYTLNETDPKKNQLQVASKDGQLSVDLPDLMPNASYRVMIESINGLGDSVTGTWFTCDTSTDLPLPPPTNLKYHIINETHVEIRWNPVVFGEYFSAVDGYVLHLRKDKNREKEIFVPDPNTRTKIIGKLRPTKTYYVSIAARSPFNGESPLKSDKLPVSLPPSENIMEPQDYLFEEEEYAAVLKAEFRFKVALVCAIVTVSSLVLFLLFNCCYFFVFPRIRRWRQRTENERIQRMRSNASSALSLDSRIAIIQEPLMVETGEVLPLLQLPPDPPGFEDNPYRKDTYGPPGGFRSTGNKKFMRMMKDPDFLRRIEELNRDPTGLGLDACGRDKYYMELQKESDRIFREVAARERAEIALAKQKAEANKRKKSNLIPQKLSITSNVLETSFINGRRTPTTSLKDLKIDNPAFKSPASSSLTELSDQEVGLSPRSKTATFYHKFIPTRKPSFLSSFLKVNEVPTQNEAQQLCSPTSNGLHSAVNQFNENHPPASSLPNLADSGIVYDEHNGSNASSSHSGGPFRPGDRSGSATLVDEMATPPASRSIFSTGQLRDCRVKNGAFRGAASPAALVP